jgi:hypothetical protein
MSIKNHELYPKYLLWLEEKNETTGSLELSKISKSLFEDFRIRYDLNPTFKEKIDKLYKSIDREEKIDVIVEDDFEIFLEEIDLASEPPPFHEDNLFDF